MISTIKIYVEGGGDSRDGKAQLRQGFDVLFQHQKEAARKRRLGLNFVMCGGREATCDAFLNAACQSRDSMVGLLVDAEGPLKNRTNEGRVEHLVQRDRWELKSVDCERVHLMVQCMEAWLVADPEAVAGFYGKDFLPSALPTRRDLEDEPKQSLYDGLRRATQHTQKGEYGKVKHASALLGRIAVERVSMRCHCFGAFTEWLDRVIDEA